MFHIYGLIGLFLVFLSFMVSFFTTQGAIFFNLVTQNSLFVTGFWLFTDALDYYLNDSSILHRIMKTKKLFFYLVLVGIFIGLLFDFYGILISRLWGWYFPNVPTWLAIVYYSKGLFFTYGVAILMYISFYRVIFHLF